MLIFRNLGPIQLESYEPGQVRKQAALSRFANVKWLAWVSIFLNNILYKVFMTNIFIV